MFRQKVDRTTRCANDSSDKEARTGRYRSRVLTECGVVVWLHVEQAPPRHDLIVRTRQRAAETLFRDGVGGDEAEAGPVHEARDQQPRVVLRTDEQTALAGTIRRYSDV
eukprot:COSAG04_NODE_1908_length_5256_cov_8.400039_4_plen_109_part_00